MGIGLWKVFTRLIGSIAVCFLITGLLLTSIEWVAFDLDHYDKEYKRLDIPGSTGISQEDLIIITQDILNYLRGKREDLNVSAPVHGQERDIFNQRETQHMVDVKELFVLAYKLRWISFGLFVGILVILIRLRGKSGLRDLGVLYLVILAILGVFSIILLILIYIDFTSVWNEFHHIFFTNDLWLLDPDKDILIQMVPEEFFFATVMRILRIFGSLLLTLALISGIAIRKTGKYSRDE